MDQPKKKLSRNQRYEQKKREQGLVKVALWLPEGAVVDFKQMAEFCIENEDHIPFMVRSLTTGKMKKAV